MRSTTLFAASLAFAAGAEHGAGRADHRDRWAGDETPHHLDAQPDGTVRQHWESTDAKGAWSTAFDGLYIKK
jgi:hypothetical protein